MILILTVSHAMRAKTMAKAHLKLVTPATVKRTVRPRRLPNGKLRTREYLTPTEVEALMEAAKGNRYGHRDATMVLVAYRHGLRDHASRRFLLGRHKRRTISESPRWFDGPLRLCENIGFNIPTKISCAPFSL